MNNPTKGPWFQLKNNNLCIESPSGNVALCNLARESDADAKLICEAGTVATETGFGPRQLAEQRAELIAALAIISTCIPDQSGGVTLGAYEMGIVQAILAKVGKVGG